MEFTIIIEKVVAFSYLIVGFSMIFQSRAWLNFIDTLQTQGMMPHYLALLYLPVGFAIVFFHPIWTFSPAIIVTLLGWIAVIKSSLYLLFPKTTMQLIPRKLYLKRLLLGNGVLLSILCLLVLYPLYFGSI